MRSLANILGDYLKHYAVNTVAPIRICYRLIPPMIKRGFGRVINISSTIQKRPGEMAYACSKAALSKFVHDMAPGLEGTGVMMSLVCPGYVRSDMGGPNAPHRVESVIPGALLGALTGWRHQWPLVHCPGLCGAELIGSDGEGKILLRQKD